MGFISKFYTGNISDKELTMRCGFLNIPHNQGAMWLVDKGFLNMPHNQGAMWLVDKGFLNIPHNQGAMWLVDKGFLNMPHNQGAMWLVDKGFQIAELAQPLSVSVNMPCFVSDRKQMTAEEVFHTQTVASIIQCTNQHHCVPLLEA